MTQIGKDKKKEFMKLEKADRSSKTFFRTMEDSINCFSWYMLSDNKDDFMPVFDDFFGIDFNGHNLTEGNQKPWYQSFRAVHKDFHDFVKNNFPDVMKWHGQSEDIEPVYKNALQNLGKGGMTQVVQQIKEEVK